MLLNTIDIKLERQTSEKSIVLLFNLQPYLLYVSSILLNIS